MTCSIEVDASKTTQKHKCRMWNKSNEEWKSIQTTKELIQRGINEVHDILESGGECNYLFLELLETLQQKVPCLEKIDKYFQIESPRLNSWIREVKSRVINQDYQDISFVFETDLEFNLTNAPPIFRRIVDGAEQGKSLKDLFPNLNFDLNSMQLPFECRGILTKNEFHVDDHYIWICSIQVMFLLCHICELMVAEYIFLDHCELCKMFHKATSELALSHELVLEMKKEARDSDLKLLNETKKIQITNGNLYVPESLEDLKTTETFKKVIQRLIRAHVDLFKLTQLMTQSKKLHDVFFKCGVHSFSPQSAEPTHEDYEMIKPISRGAFGTVYLAKKKNTLEYFAIKVLSKANVVSKNQISNVKFERLLLMMQADSPYVAKLYVSFQTQDSLYLVMEYMNGGDCASLLKAVGVLPENWAKLYTAEMVQILEYLHQIGIIHRDLKPDNFLIDQFGHLKLADFGLSKVGINSPSPRRLSSSSSSEDESNPLITQCLVHYRRNSSASFSSSDSINSPKTANSVIGTPDYIAPELFNSNDDDFTVDWWALGIIVYEFLMGTPPFHATALEQILCNIANLKVVFDQEISSAAKDLVSQLLERNPKKRLGILGAEQVKNHVFFNGIDWINLRNSEPAFVPRTNGIEDTTYFDPRGADLANLSEKTLSPMDETDFGSFSYKNLNLLEKANNSSAKLLSKKSVSRPRVISFSQSSTPEQSPSPTGRYNALICDQSAVSRKILETILPRFNFTCYLALNGEDAVKAAVGSLRFAVIFIDLKLPIIDGETVAKVIRSTQNINKNTPIIGVSAYEMAPTLNISHILAKPLKKNEISQIIKNIC